jgi:hypothetical protein
MKFFHFATMFRSAMGSTQPNIQLLPGALFPEVRRPGREAVHPHPSTAVVKNDRSSTYTPPIRLHDVVFSYARYIFTAWCLVKHRDNFKEIKMQLIDL